MIILEYLILGLTAWVAWHEYRLVELKSLWRDGKNILDRIELLEQQETRKQTREILDSLNIKEIQKDDHS